MQEELIEAPGTMGAAAATEGASVPNSTVAFTAPLIEASAISEAAQNPRHRVPRSSSEVTRFMVSLSIQLPQSLCPARAGSGSMRGKREQVRGRNQTRPEIRTQAAAHSGLTLAALMALLQRSTSFLR